MADHGVTTEFIRQTQDKGLKNLSLEYPTPDIAGALNAHHVVAGYGANVVCPIA